MPRIPRVSIKLYKEDHPNMIAKGDDDDNINWENYKVTLKCIYSDT